MLTIISGILGSGIFLAAITFVFNLNNRLTVVETRQDDLPALIEEKFESVEKRLDRIERSMNGFLHKD